MYKKNAGWRCGPHPAFVDVAAKPPQTNKQQQRKPKKLNCALLVKVL
jgi:hypothetical protein